MLSLHVGLTLACLATTPIMWIITAIFSRMVRPMYDRNRELVDLVVLRLAESIQGVQVIKGFGREREEIARFAADNRAVRDQQQGIFWRVSLFGPAIGYMTQINLVILLAYGGWLVTQNQLAARQRPRRLRGPAAAVLQPGREPHEHRQQRAAKPERRAASVRDSRCADCD